MFVNAFLPHTSLLFLFLPIIAWNYAVAASADCVHTFHLFPQQQLLKEVESNDTSSAVNGTNDGIYTLLEDTKQCDELLTTSKQLLEAVSTSTIAKCADGLVDVDLSPISIFPVGKNILPYVQLNISLVSNSSQVSEAFFTFQCLHAPNTNDYLCHKHNIQVQKWGRMIWPCRRLTLNNTGLAGHVFHFSYACFRLFSLSQYSVEIYVLRRDQPICRRAFLVTIPLERHLDPKIDSFYRGNNGNPSGFVHPQMKSWSPLLSVDITPEDAIHLHLSPMGWIQPTRHINISIFSHHKSSDLTNTTRLVLNERVFPTAAMNSNINSSSAMANHGRKRYKWAWKEVDAGEYTIYAFLDDGHCQISCPTVEVGDGHQCLTCPHTSLNLTLSEPRHSPEWRRTLLLMAVGKHVAIGAFVILVLTSLILLAGFIYVRYWRPRVIARRPPRSVELLGRPNVLVLYTDDCEAHCEAVTALCAALEEGANVHCVLDQLEFIRNPALRPSVWLAEKLAECDFVLVIFSECSKRVMAGERLLQRRHFPDHFNTAISFVMAKVNEIATAEGVRPLLRHSREQKQRSGRGDCLDYSPLEQTTTTTAECFSSSATSTKSRLDRFLFARFSYSPGDAIPVFFASSQFGGGPLVLPDQTGPLIARLHGIQNGSGTRPVGRGHPNGLNNGTSRFEHQADLGRLQEAIEQFKRFKQDEPDWMGKRFAKLEEGKSQTEGEGGGSPNISSIQTPKGIPTAEEQVRLAEHFKLLRPEEEEEDGQLGQDQQENEPNQRPLAPSAGASKKYTLIGRPEDFGDDGSSSSSSNKSSRSCSPSSRHSHSQ